MICLGLGSNTGSRRDNLWKALQELQSRGFKVSRVSPVVETPAMLPDQADPAWCRPFLNCVIQGDCDWSASQGLEIARQVESNLGRKPSPRWSPRVMDIDLLLWHGEIISESTAAGDLGIPHYGILDRNFVLTPLLHLQPDLVIPGQEKSVFELSKIIKPIPLWMGILNITPDSFSDGGAWNDRKVLEAQVDSFIENNVQIIDIGAESTRPHADPVDPEQEWKRLQPVVEMIRQKIGDNPLGPAVSIDSRHWQTLQKSLEKSPDSRLDYINDVTGLHDPNIMALARDSGCQVIAMHSMTIPVDPKQLLPTDRSALDQLAQWAGQKIETWLSAGLDLNRIIIDPGIGFGKNRLQALELLRNIVPLRESGLRLLVGHSRKSFMNSFSGMTFSGRDPETLGISLALCEQGVDIIRVHDPVNHIRAYRAWAHV